MKRVWVYGAAAVAIFALSACQAKEAPPPEDGPSAAAALGASEPSADINFPTSDGWEIYATFWPAADEAAPAAVLLHTMRSDRHAYDNFAPKLAAVGFNVLALDSRGHGESLKHAGKTSRFADFDDAAYNSSVTDVAAAKGVFGQKGADSSKLVVVGASIGANFALNYAAGDDDVAAVALLSPGLDYHGVKTERAMAAYGGRPAFLVASDEDKYSATTVAKLHEVAPQAEVKVFSGAGHGTDIFAAEPTLEGELIAWLSAQVK